MIDEGRLQILVDGAKYDVSCSSSGSSRKNKSGGLGNAAFGGICHSFTQDGRCISLLKILLSNDCVFDCKYCPNRRSADVPRASVSPEELCELVIEFYRRNYIEGLFLSSAVHKNPDYTMELLLKTVRLLREEYRFNGYIHLKGIPHADDRLTRQAAKYADRMSYNLELPSEQSLKLLAPQKTKKSVLLPMKSLQEGREEAAALWKAKTGKSERRGMGKFLPAGQTTQMIVGASPETDGKILRLSEGLYRKFALKRVYFSSYIPVVNDPLLPSVGAGLLREHRLYQADWLLRFYGFESSEIVDEQENLSTEYDPKCAWALRNMHLFPVEINSADVETLLRVPGIGAKGAYKIVAARRFASLTFSDLQKMRIVLKRARHFITCAGKFYGVEGEEKVKSALSMAERLDGASQMSFFDGENSGLLLPKEKQPSLSLLTQTEDAEKRFLLTSSAENARAVLSGQF
ncbi:MAG: putative DNA modification/repair radical SAM protein [Clostridiales bacterium]|nr:putative DNA modification/repair radical SAM protein [Clostridiales bacterium]